MVHRGALPFFHYDWKSYSDFLFRSLANLAICVRAICESKWSFFLFFSRILNDFSFISVFPHIFYHIVGRYIWIIWFKLKLFHVMTYVCISVFAAVYLSIVQPLAVIHHLLLFCHAIIMCVGIFAYFSICSGDSLCVCVSERVRERVQHLAYINLNII